MQIQGENVESLQKFMIFFSLLSQKQLWFCEKTTKCETF